MHGAHRLLPLLIVLLAACTSLRRPPGLEERVARIEQDRLTADIEALHGIGPRPIEDVEATAATVAWLRERLEGLGYEVLEEEVSYPTTSGRLVARVRRADGGPDAEIEELPLEPGAGRYGARVLESRSRTLRAQGWDVLGYVMQGLDGAWPGPLVAPNLFVEIPGSELPDRVLEVSAHYDTVPGSSGASDNSSGVAVLLELARVLADSRPRKTVRLCFFAAEEAGLVGSRLHVERLAADETSVVEALLNVDSVGHASDAPDSQRAPVRIPLVTWMPSVGDFVTVIGTNATGWLGDLFERCADAYVPDLEYYSANRIGGWFADGRRSDHAHYWDAGIPAVFLTDTGEFRSDTYHRPDDAPDTVDPVFVHRVARAVCATLLELDAR